MVDRICRQGRPIRVGSTAQPSGPQGRRSALAPTPIKRHAKCLNCRLSTYGSLNFASTVLRSPARNKKSPTGTASAFGIQPIQRSEVPMVTLQLGELDPETTAVPNPQ